MTAGLLHRGEQLLECANACREKIESFQSKLEALQSISRYVSKRLDDYQFSAAGHPDEISVSFIRLLDQIVFEMTENLPADAAVREYVVEDLYARLAIFLDIYSGRETYACGLKKRLLAHEDTVIIRQCRLKEYVPLLISEFDEQPLLQRSIIRCLISFESDDLLEFYYTIACESGSPDIKSMALVGLKKFGQAFRRWDLGGANDETYGRLAAYVKGFDGVDLEKNPVPEDLNSIMFVMQYIESCFDAAYNERTLGWIMNILGTIPVIGYYNSFLNDLYELLCAIIMNAGRDNLLAVLRDDTMTRSLIAAVDFLPREYFDRIIPLLSLIEDELVSRVDALMASVKIKLDERESNILGFMLWKRGGTL